MKETLPFKKNNQTQHRSLKMTPQVCSERDPKPYCNQNTNQDYGSVSNYSTLRTTTRDEYDYDTLSRSTGIVSEEELEK